MFRQLLRIRYLAAISALVFAADAVGFLALGVVRSAHAFAVLLHGGGAEDGRDRPGLHFAESVDLLLFSLVLIVLAVGTASLFLVVSREEQASELPPWMRVKSLTELKLVLWEALLATLVVTTATEVIADLPNLQWRHLLLPGVVLTLSVSYFLLKHSTAEE